MKMGEGEYKLILERLMRPEFEWKKEILGEWSEEAEQAPKPKQVYILASNYQIAKAIYRRLYPEGRIIDLRYVREPEIIMGLRGIEVIISNERYPSNSFYYVLDYLRSLESLGKLRLVYEQNIQKEQDGKDIFG